jgi:hypothetical protein
MENKRLPLKLHEQEQEEDQVQRTLTGAKERERLRKITMVERWSFWGVSVYFLA